MEIEAQILRLAIVGGFLSMGLVAAILLSSCFSELHRLVQTASPWQRTVVMVFLAVAVVFAGGKGTNDAQGEGQVCGNGRQSVAVSNRRMTSFGGDEHLQWRSSANERDFDDFNMRLDIPGDLVVSNLVFYGIRPESGPVLFALTWPQMDPTDDYCALSLYANWTLGGSPWIKVDTMFFWWSHRYLAGRLNWPALVDAAVVEGLFPTNATPDACFLRAAWSGDADDDLLEDGDELYVFGTDPENSDTDNDAMSDGWETDYGTNPLNPDTDGDGLVDGWELLYDFYGFDPLVSNAESVVEADWDGDGLPNIMESRCGTDPWSNMSDLDWLPDVWEIRHGLDPLSEVGDDGDDGDPDRDGLSNYDEYDLGTDPTDPDTDDDGLPDSVDSHPLVSDGSFFGQCDRWVLDNLSNASQVLSIGYTNWVNEQVGIGLTNGCYALNVRVLQDPVRPILVCVGARRMIVNAAGEYPFLLAKGSRYELSVSSEDALVDFEAIDDLRGERAGGLRQSASAQWANGEWSTEAGRLVLVPPGLGVVGYVVWLPSLSVSPSTWEPTESSPSQTFAATFADAPSGYSASSYSWSGGGEIVSIGTPSAASTLMTCLDPYAGVPSLTLTVNLAGETMHSYFTVRHEPGVVLTFDLPDTLFVDDDDDNDDGDQDYCLMDEENDDVAAGGVSLSSDHFLSGTFSVERLDARGCVVEWAEDLFGEWHAMGVGSRWDVQDRKNWSLRLRACASSQSRSFEPCEIRIRWRSNGGFSQLLTKRFTVVRPVAEPICAEWVPNGAGRSVLNPCGVVVGRDSVFRIGVKPDAYPDSKIVWSATGAGTVAFPEGNSGREVKVCGVSAGEVTLRAQIGECTASAPSFHAKVVQPKTVKLSAWIVADKDGATAFTPAQVRTMVREANEIYSQVGVTLNVGSRIVITNVPSAYNVLWEGTTNTMWNFAQLTGLNSDTGGLECYFVNKIYRNGQGVNRQIIGGHSASGLMIASDGDGTTLAHEIGHAFGMEDVYCETQDGSVELLTFANWKSCMDDWNGGCNGHGAAGSRYYPGDFLRGFYQRGLIMRMLMNGFRELGSEDVDIAYGNVDGLNENGETETRATGFFASGQIDNPVHQ